MADNNYISAGQRQPGYIGRGQRPPDYISAGQRQPGYIGRGQLPSGYRPASGIINARIGPENTKGFSGLAGFDALQRKGTKAFPTPGFEGMDAPAIGEQATKAGVRIGPQQPVSMREQITGGSRTDSAGYFPSQTGSRIGGDVVTTPSPAATRPMPTAADTAARAQEIASERDMQRDMQNKVSRTMDGAGRTTGISSKYGSGSSTTLTPQQQASRAPGMVKDDFNRTVPIREEISRMSYNQASKGIGPEGQPIAPVEEQVAGVDPAGVGPTGVGPTGVGPTGAAGNLALRKKIQGGGRA